jgi:hypothetical protein
MPLAPDPAPRIRTAMSSYSERGGAGLDERRAWVYPSTPFVFFLIELLKLRVQRLRIQLRLSSCFCKARFTHHSHLDFSRVG